MTKGERMGHSMGNFITIQKILESHDAEALRLYYGMRHYRSQLEFNESDIGQAEQVLDKLRAVYNQFKELASSKATEGQAPNQALEQLSSVARQRFVDAMDDDFNTPRALASMITYAKDAEPYAQQQIGPNAAQLIVDTFDYFSSVFGILRPSNAPQDKAFQGLLKVLVELREEARKKGDWGTADSIRNDLARLGIGLEDTPTGVRWFVASANAKSR